MKVDALLSELTYRGEATGLSQTYCGFQGPQHILVLSFLRTKPHAGYCNVVDAEAVKTRTSGSPARRG